MREEGRSSSSSSSKLRKAAKKMILAAAKACGSFSKNESSLVDPIAFDRSSYNPNSNSASISGSSRAVSPKKPNDAFHEDVVSATEDFESPISASTLHSDQQKLCAICLEALKYGSKSKMQAIFTAQCSHAFHFSCISSNVRHGSLSCPICRARWTHLPRTVSSLSDPALRILDDSIATFRVHRRSLLRPHHHHRLRLSLSAPDSILTVSLADRRPTDLVLLATPNGPHLRLLKQCMALVAFSLRPVDRLAVVVAHSSRLFPLRRMTPCGRRAALQVVDRLFYSGHAADSLQGLEKAASILRDNGGLSDSSSSAAILHLSDSPTTEFFPSSAAVPVHSFHVGDSVDGLVMRDFGEFLAGMLGGGEGGAVSDVQLRVRTREGSRVVRIGELCAGEESRVLLGGDLGGHAFVEYSYREDHDGGGGEDDDEGFVRGESLVSVGDDNKLSRSSEAVIAGGRLSSSVESWDYHDPYMARRWAKHLHGYRL